MYLQTIARAFSSVVKQWACEIENELRLEKQGRRISKIHCYPYSQLLEEAKKIWKDAPQNKSDDNSERPLLQMTNTSGRPGFSTDDLSSERLLYDYNSYTE
uniref:Uncharacterized protein n=1 Tax=Pristionchus pacificus TaxID=54126 RepID=A0A2A6C711_PRIPA|eukprot:PDM73858.1 hypothetical protein PRIPAC_41214 [Pristionchus pacificus]